LWHRRPGVRTPSISLQKPCGYYLQGFFFFKQTTHAVFISIDHYQHAAFIIREKITAQPKELFMKEFEELFLSVYVAVYFRFVA
jgi:hypothetical protein